jgi:hypothetical protein
MSQFDDDFAAADAMFAEAFGVPVRIVRNGRASAAVTAQVVTRENEVRDDNNFPQVIRSRDYLISVTDYQADGVAVEPLKSDLIVEVIGGAEITCALARIGKKPQYEYADDRRRQWLIRTVVQGSQA